MILFCPTVSGSSRSGSTTLIKNKTCMILSLNILYDLSLKSIKRGLMQSTTVQYLFPGTYSIPNFFTIQKLLLPCIDSQTFSNLSANLIHSRIHAIHSRLNLIRSRLHLIYFRPNLDHSRLDLIHSPPTSHLL